MAIDVRSRLGVSDKELAEFCRRWKIVELEVFGSALSDDFDEKESDIDLLVSYSIDAEWSLLDHVQVKDELSALIGRPVDLLTRRSVERSRNPLRRKRILETAQRIYAA
jgi:uncharacterized protein